MSGTAGIHVRIHRGLAGLQELSRDWRDLNQRETAPRAMSRFEWYDALLRHRLEDPDSVRFAAIHDAGGCQAILPLAPMRNPPRWLGLLRPWSLPTDPHANLCDIPVARGFCLRDAHPALWQALDGLSPAPRVLCLPLGLEGCNADQVSRNANRWLLARDNGRSCQFDTSEGHAAIAGRYATRLRKSIKRGRAKLSQSGAWQVVRITEPAAMDAALSTFLALEASGWKGRNGTGSAIALNARTTAFYRSLFVDQGPQLGAEIDILLLEGRAIAAQLALNSSDMRHTLKIAYDETCAVPAPGLVLLDTLLATTCETGERRFFSLTTCAGWMQDWNPVQVPVRERWLFRSPLCAGIARLISRFGSKERAAAQGHTHPNPTETVAG